jgi:hypothetical protein
MDALDRLAGPAADLLARVDATLAAGGAEPDHPVWPLLRRLGALPGDAAGAVSALRPGPLATAASAVRPLARAYADTAADLRRAVSWSGPAAEAYAASAEALAEHGGGVEGLPARLRNAGDYAAALCGWMAETRRELARALADALGSAQAVALHATDPAGPPHPEAVAAAADIAARVLSAVAAAYEHADRLRDEWSDRLPELPFRPPGPLGPTGDITTVGR